MAEPYEFVVQKTCRVQLDDRSIVVCAPGDPLPKNAVISNPRLWIDSGYLAEKNNQFVPKAPTESRGVIPASGPPPRAPAPKPGEPIGAGMKPPDRVPAFRVPPESSAVASSPSPVASGDEVTADSLSELTKVELMSLGEEVGVKLDSTMKKADMIEALLNTQE